jgi:signal transduction histidine kinase
MITEVARLIQELEVTAERQASFVLNMAHDLRNPIQNVIVLADVLKNATLPVEKVIQHASRIATQVRRLNLLSQRVWTLVTIEREGFDASADKRLRLYDVVNQWVDLLQESATSRSLTVVIDRTLKDWSPVFVNELLCTQAVLNLLDNAIKYSSVGTEVRIYGEEDADTYHLSFSNRGIGIPPEETDRIFEKFHRARAAQEHVREGTGIGLAVVKFFAEHYGDISVTSVPIRGSGDHKTVFRLSVRKRSARYV